MKLMLFCLMFIIGLSIFSAEIKGICDKVIDGDTIILKDGNDKFKVRFADIDAPEISQDFGQNSKDYLISLIQGKYLIVEFHEIDMYGRIIGTLTLFKKYRLLYFKDDISVNEMMVKNGYAWWFKDYSKNKEFEKFEYEAKINKKGLWKNEQCIPPWEYRKIKRKNKK